VAAVAERVRRTVYEAFAATGRCPSRTDLPERLGIGQDEADRGLAELAAARHLALDPAGEVAHFPVPMAGLHGPFWGLDD
jgi:hypothetical protein